MSIDYSDAAFDAARTGVYVELFNGRRHPDEQLDDWGADGPLLGPFNVVHITYNGDPRIDTEEDRYLQLVEGHLLYYDGMFYGDWTYVSAYAVSMMDEEVKRTIRSFDLAKATPPSELPPWVPPAKKKKKAKP